MVGSSCSTSEVDRDIEPQSGKTKNCEMYIYCFSTKTEVFIDHCVLFGFFFIIVLRVFFDSRLLITNLVSSNSSSLPAYILVAMHFKDQETI